MDAISSASRRWSLRLRWLGAFGLLFTVLILYQAQIHKTLSWENVRSELHSWQRLTAERPVKAACFFALVYISVTALSLPVSTGLSILAGALFGRGLGVVLVSISATIGATLAMWSSRFLLRDVVERRIGSRLRPIWQGIAKDGVWYLLSLRLAAVFPFFLVNLAVGLTRLPTRSYVMATWLGMLPANFLFVNAGTAAMTIESPRDVFNGEVLLALILLALIPLLLRSLARREIKSVSAPVGDSSRG